MKIGIVGRPQVGKTTVFNTLAQSNAEVGGYTSRGEINLSTANIPDERLTRLAEILEPSKITPATIDYVDVAGVTKSDVEQAELDSGLLAELRTVDALAHVVRLFEDESVPHVDGRVDAERDIESVSLEFAFADLQIVEGRLDRLRKQYQNQKLPAQQNEIRLLEACQATLESGKPLRGLELSTNEEKLIRGYGFLTQKPLLLVCNIGETQLEAADEILEHFTKYEAEPQTAVIVLAAQLEMELSELDETDTEIFMEEMGLRESALERFIQTSYRLLGLLTFFTINPTEARAWTLREGQTAVDAAGRIHTDFANAFIRSETINWEDLITCGSYIEARSKGLLRAEGKTYQVQEGDVLLILANPTN
ncbi:redox-regulated ATPase YchF [Candidatus Poribacteria bacterium]|nr:redox-regulated ATPase YchF [Candidatus Poribacteria bacterium]MYB00693.1 redox-regulated ATPase YchF [Candidatus Poribacteria bacterium]